MKSMNIMETPRQALNNAHIKACMMLGIDESEWDNVKTDRDVMIAVSDIMMDTLKGRPYPIKKTKTHAVKSIQERNVLFKDTYPKHIVSDIDKIHYLQEKLQQKSISAQIYYEIAEVLNVPKALVNNVSTGIQFIK